MEHWEITDMPFDTDVTDDKIVCQNCSWSWKVKDGGDDLYVCHKCFTDNTSVYLQEKHSNFAVDPNAIIQGVTAVAQLGGGIAQSSSAKKMSQSEIQKEIEARCGKDKSKGLRRRKVKEAYIECRNKALQIIDARQQQQFGLNQQNEQQRQQQQELLLKSSQQQQKNKIYLIIGAIAVLIIGFVVYKKMKK
jgi:hypothetical protein